MNSRINIFLFLLISTLGYSQNGLNSPFSRFGLGDLNDQGFMHLRQMGNISASFADAYHLNIVNPASYAYLKATSFEIGVESKFSSYQDPSQRESTNSGQLSYMALGFPLKNPINSLFERERSNIDLGMAFSLVPVSTVAYNIVLETEDEDFGSYERVFTGEGGIYKVNWGTAIKYKGLSAGINLGMNFGKISNERSTNFLDDPAAFDNLFVSDFNISGFDYNIGLLYQHIINKKDLKEATLGKTIKAVNIGITAKTKTGFGGTQEVFFRNQIRQDFFVARTDTLINETNDINGGKLPSEYSFGITYISGAKFALGLNYGITNWSEYVNPVSPESLINTKRYSIGGYYRPNPASITNFFERVYYRFGLYYKEDPRVVRSQDLSTYGVSFGLGLPLAFQRKISHLSVGFDYGKRGTAEILKENFFKVSLGFTFNDDEWFLKRKFN